MTETCSLPVSIQKRESLFCIKFSVTPIMPMLDGKRIYIRDEGRYYKIHQTMVQGYDLHSYIPYGTLKQTIKRRVMSQLQ